MRKIKEVLRLRFELGLGQRQIARSCGMGLGTVHEYLERAVAAGIGWPLPESLSEEELEAKLFGNQPVQAGAVRQRPEPDWNNIHQQLRQHRRILRYCHRYGPQLSLYGGKLHSDRCPGCQ